MLQKISAVDGKHRMRYTASIHGFPLSGRFCTGGHTACEQNAALYGAGTAPLFSGRRSYRSAEPYDNAGKVKRMPGVSGYAIAHFREIP